MTVRKFLWFWMGIEKKASFKSILASQSPFLRRSFSVRMPSILFTICLRLWDWLLVVDLHPSWGQERDLPALSTGAIPLLLPSIVILLFPLKSDKSALQSIMNCEVYVDVALRSPNSPESNSTNVVGTNLPAGSGGGGGVFPQKCWGVF